MPTPSLIRRRPPTARSGRKEALRDEGASSRKKTEHRQATALATAAGVLSLAIWP